MTKKEEETFKKFKKELRALQMELVNPMLTKAEEEAINVKIRELIKNRKELAKT